MIKKLLSTEVVTVFEGTSIQEVARLMDERCVGMIVVTELYSQGKPVGLVTDRDIVIKCVKSDLNPRTEKIENIMSRLLITVPETTSIEDAIKAMEVNQIRRLLVIDDAGKIKGIVSLDDLVALLGSEINRIGNLCRNQLGTTSRHRSHDYTKMA